MTVNEFLNKYNHVETYPTYYGGVLTHQSTRPWAVCEDGFTVSIQAGSHLYCSPRVDGAESYDEVELGFPSAADELIMVYAEDPEDPTETVYGYTPVSLVDELMEKHGGIVGIKARDRQWITGKEDENGVSYF